MIVKVDSPVEIGKFYRKHPVAKDIVVAVKKTVKQLDPKAYLGISTLFNPEDGVTTFQIWVYALKPWLIIESYAIYPFCELAKQEGFDLVFMPSTQAAE